MNCVECDRELHGSVTKCICGWVIPALSAPLPEYHQPAKPFVRARPETVEKFKASIKNFGHQQGAWWTPEKVKNAQQVNLIVIQANRFGPMSQQGRFLQACKDYGCIGEDNLLRRVRERQPFEDEDYGRAA